MAYVAFETFSRSNIDVARDTMKDEIASMTRDALNYYRRQRHIGGGGYSFHKFNDVRRRRARPKSRKPPKGELLWESENGVYKVVATSPDSVVIDGLGDYVGYDERNPIWVRGVIKTDRLYFVVLN